jgi:hypothetical protein
MRQTACSHLMLQSSLQLPHGSSLGRHCLLQGWGHSRGTRQGCEQGTCWAATSRRATSPACRATWRQDPHFSCRKSNSCLCQFQPSSPVRRSLEGQYFLPMPCDFAIMILITTNHNARWKTLKNELETLPLCAWNCKPCRCVRRGG